MIASGEAAIYVPSLASRNILSRLPVYMGPLASLRGGQVLGLPVVGLLVAAAALFVAEHLRRRRGR